MTLEIKKRVDPEVLKWILDKQINLVFLVACKMLTFNK
jgi:hypothetical protein